MLHDNIIVKVIYPGKLPKAKYLKRFQRYPNITEYLRKRFDYVDTLKEALDRIKYNIEVRPICKECGNKVKYIGLNKFNLIYRDFCCVKCSNTNKLKQQKCKETCYDKYGVDNPRKAKEIKEKIVQKTKQTCLERYGVDNSRKYPNTIQKGLDARHKTNLIKYGVEEVFLNEEVKNKCKESYKRICLQKYGVDNYSKTIEFKSKIKETCQQRYDVDNIFSIEKVKRKIRDKVKEHTGYEYAINQPYVIEKTHSKECISKQQNTKRKNHTFNSSKQEDILYSKLLEVYSKEDIIRQYKSDNYPFCCDFYIKSIDTYIELQGMWTHGKHPFDNTVEEDILTLQQWQQKASTSKFYKNAIETWTISDVKKREMARKNNLNFIEIFGNNFEILHNISIL